MGGMALAPPALLIYAKAQRAKPLPTLHSFYAAVLIERARCATNPLPRLFFTLRGELAFRAHSTLLPHVYSRTVGEATTPSPNAIVGESPLRCFHRRTYHLAIARHTGQL